MSKIKSFTFVYTDSEKKIFEAAFQEGLKQHPKFKKKYDEGKITTKPGREKATERWDVEKDGWVTIPGLSTLKLDYSGNEPEIMDAFAKSVNRQFSDKKAELTKAEAPKKQAEKTTTPTPSSTTTPTTSSPSSRKNSHDSGSAIQAPRPNTPASDNEAVVSRPRTPTPPKPVEVLAEKRTSLNKPLQADYSEIPKDDAKQQNTEKRQSGLNYAAEPYKQPTNTQPNITAPQNQQEVTTKRPKPEYGKIEITQKPVVESNYPDFPAQQNATTSPKTPEKGDYGNVPKDNRSKLQASSDYVSVPNQQPLDKGVYGNMPKPGQKPELPPAGAKLNYAQPSIIIPKTNVTNAETDYGAMPSASRPGSSMMTNQPVKAASPIVPKKSVQKNDDYSYMPSPNSTAPIKQNEGAKLNYAAQSVLPTESRTRSETNYVKKLERPGKPEAKKEESDYVKKLERPENQEPKRVAPKPGDKDSPYQKFIFGRDKEGKPISTEVASIPTKPSIPPKKPERNIPQSKDVNKAGEKPQGWSK